MLFLSCLYSHVPQLSSTGHGLALWTSSWSYSRAYHRFHPQTFQGGLCKADSCLFPYAHLHFHTYCHVHHSLRFLSLPRTWPPLPALMDLSFLTFLVQATKAPTLSKQSFVFCLRIAHRPKILMAGNNFILLYIPQACSFWPFKHGKHHCKLIPNCK